MLITILCIVLPFLLLCCLPREIYKWIGSKNKKEIPQTIDNPLVIELTSSLEYEYDQWLIGKFNIINEIRSWELEVFMEMKDSDIKMKGLRLFTPTECNTIRDSIKICLQNQILYCEGDKKLLGEVQEREIKERIEEKTTIMQGRLGYIQKNGVLLPPDSLASALQRQGRLLP